MEEIFGKRIGKPHTGLYAWSRGTGKQKKPAATGSAFRKACSYWVTEDNLLGKK